MLKCGATISGVEELHSIVAAEFIAAGADQDDTPAVVPGGDDPPATNQHGDSGVPLAEATGGVNHPEAHLPPLDVMPGHIVQASQGRLNVPIVISPDNDLKESNCHQVLPSDKMPEERDHGEVVETSEQPRIGNRDKAELTTEYATVDVVLECTVPSCKLGPGSVAWRTANQPY